MFEKQRQDIGFEIRKVLNYESIPLGCPVDDVSVIGVLDITTRVYVEYLEDIP